MKKILILLAMLISSAVLSAKEAEVTADKTVTKVTFYSPEIVRVTKTPAGEAGNTRASLVVTMTPQEGLKVTKSENSSAVTLKSPVLTVRIDKKTGLVQFLAKGKNLLKERHTDLRRGQKARTREATAQPSCTSSTRMSLFTDSE